MVSEIVLVAEERKEWADGVVDQGLHERPAKTAIVFGVVDKQGRPRRPHRREVRVVFPVR